MGVRGAVRFEQPEIRGDHRDCIVQVMVMRDPGSSMEAEYLL